jgi:hypothetical protein
MGDLMITLLPKGDRSRSSHEIAVDLREKLKAIPLPAGGSLKVVETPPGPPVLATLLAEIYGPDEATRQKTAVAGRGDLQGRCPTSSMSTTASASRARRSSLFPTGRSSITMALSERQLFDSIGALLGSQTVGYAPRGGERDPLPIELALDQAQRHLVRLAGRNPGRRNSPGGQLWRWANWSPREMEPGGQPFSAAMGAVRRW